MRTESMKGQECLYGKFLDRPTPNICQEGCCQDCQIYLDFTEGNHLKSAPDLIREANELIKRGEL